jgi:peptidylprolyl isomerase
MTSGSVLNRVQASEVKCGSGGSPFLTFALETTSLLSRNDHIRLNNEETNMKNVEKGHFVKLHYTGTLDDGEVFDSSQGCKPFEIQVGAGQVIKGFDDALMGMAINEKKTFTVQSSDAFGERDESLNHEFPRSDLPADFNPKVGEVLVLESPERGEVPATVKFLDADKIVVDLNHPLAGQNLTFNIEVLDISDAASPSSCGCGCSCG